MASPLLATLAEASSSAVQGRIFYCLGATINLVVDPSCIVLGAGF
jgi:hypothetical protein